MKKQQENKIIEKIISKKGGFFHEQLYFSQTNKGANKMNNLSLSQQYLLFTMNRQGKISSLNYYVGMCLVMAGLLDLQKANVLELNNKEVILLSNELPEDLQYLDCLLEKITGLKKKRIEAIANAYGTTFFEKDIKQLVSQIRDSLIEAEEVSIKKGFAFTCLYR